MSIYGGSVKVYIGLLTLHSIDTHFDVSTTDSFRKHCGKRRNFSNMQFLCFPQYFLLNQIIVSPFVHILDILSLFATELEEPKICLSGSGLSFKKGGFSPQRFESSRSGLYLTHSHTMTHFDAPGKQAF